MSMKEQNETILAGGWSEYSCVNEQQKEAFEEAMEGFVGKTYSPVACASQVVAGMNYKFFCNVTMPQVVPIRSQAIVEIFKPLEGKAQIHSIRDI